MYLFICNPQIDCIVNRNIFQCQKSKIITWLKDPLNELRLTLTGKNFITNPFTLYYKFGLKTNSPHNFDEIISIAQQSKLTHLNDKLNQLAAVNVQYHWHTTIGYIFFALFMVFLIALVLTKCI